MNTPIYDFVQKYAKENYVRLHMPGHKGHSFIGCESLDITEIEGADVLSHAEGIIKESEDNASSLFSSLHTYYSTEGSTLCIKAMLTLICKHAEGRPLILAARNVHKAFIYAGALLDFDVQWMYGEKSEHLCSCKITKEAVESHILSAERKPAAVYITSPDYLGNISDIKGIAEVCDKHGIPLLVDNAHGAYLNFLIENRHPLALGATICCDSAHKTLPVLTGGAYLHLSHKAEKYLSDARDALALHATTSPSYITLQSLDLCNAYLTAHFSEKLYLATVGVAETQKLLSKTGFESAFNEPLKLTLYPLSYGYTGYELADILRKEKIVCEYRDRDHVVLMAPCDNNFCDIMSVYKAIKSLEKKQAKEPSPRFDLSSEKNVMSLREAIFSPSEYVRTEDAVGRICAEPAVSCPPAVPICISGEIITAEIADAFRYFGFDEIKVIK